MSDTELQTRGAYCVATTDDRMIPLAAQHFMAQGAGAKAAENTGSHAIYVPRCDQS